MQSFLASDEAFEEDPVGGRPFASDGTHSVYDLVYLLRWVNGFELGEDWAGQVGVSGLYGPNATGSDGRTYDLRRRLAAQVGAREQRPRLALREASRARSRARRVPARTRSSTPTRWSAFDRETFTDWGGFLQTAVGLPARLVGRHPRRIRDGQRRRLRARQRVRDALGGSLPRQPRAHLSAARLPALRVLEIPPAIQRGQRGVPDGRRQRALVLARPRVPDRPAPGAPVLGRGRHEAIHHVCFRRSRARAVHGFRLRGAAARRHLGARSRRSRAPRRRRRGGGRVPRAGPAGSALHRSAPDLRAAAPRRRPVRRDGAPARDRLEPGAAPERPQPEDPAGGRGLRGRLARDRAPRGAERGASIARRATCTPAGIRTT